MYTTNQQFKRNISQIILKPNNFQHVVMCYSHCPCSNDFSTQTESTSLLAKSSCLSLARPTRHLNLAVMAAPPDAESLESRISEYLKLILESHWCSETAGTDAWLLSASCWWDDRWPQQRVSQQTGTSGRHIQDANLAPEPLRFPAVNTQIQPDGALAWRLGGSQTYR